MLMTNNTGSKLLKIVDESSESTEKSNDTYTEKLHYQDHPEEENNIDIMMMMIQWMRRQKRQRLRTLIYRMMSMKRNIQGRAENNNEYRYKYRQIQMGSSYRARLFQSIKTR